MISLGQQVVQCFSLATSIAALCSLLSAQITAGPRYTESDLIATYERTQPPQPPVIKSSSIPYHTVIPPNVHEVRADFGDIYYSRLIVGSSTCRAEVYDGWALGSSRAHAHGAFTTSLYSATRVPAIIKIFCWVDRNPYMSGSSSISFADRFVSLTTSGGSPLTLYDEATQLVEIGPNGLPATMSASIAQTATVQYGSNAGAEYLINPTGGGVNDTAISVFDAVDYVRKTPPFVVSGDLDVLCTFGQTRRGAVCDGVSQLLLRASASERGEFRLSFEAPNTGGESGELGLAGQAGSWSHTSPVASSTVALSLNEAFFCFRAPSNFVRPAFQTTDALAAKRTVSIKVEFRPIANPVWSQKLVAIELTRPPVVLSHGFASSKSTWGNRFASLRDNLDARFAVNAIDYSLDDHAARAVQDYVGVVSDEIDNGLQMLHNEGFAATRVDWVGHSMGGILPRAYYSRAVQQRGRNWSRSANFGAGDIRKLILLNSPQLGSPVADYVVRAMSHPTHGNAIQRALSAFYGNQKPLESCANDLVVCSDYLRSLGETNISTFAIVGVGGRALLGNPNLDLKYVASLLPPSYGVYYDLLHWDGSASRLNQLFGTEEHDVVVSQWSQSASLGSNHVTIMTGTDSVHWKVTTSDSYANEVVALLDRPVASFSASIPASCSTTSLSGDAVTGPSFAGGLVIASPRVDSKVMPGQNISITVEGVDPFYPRRVDLFGPTGVVSQSSKPFAFSVTVPHDAIGDIEYVAFGQDSNGLTTYSAPYRLSVVASSPLQSIRCIPPHITLHAPLDSRAINVVGKYGDLVERSITRKNAGTLYVSDNPNVVTVSSDGLVQAKAPGSARVAVRNESLQTTVVVRVQFDPITRYGFGREGSGGFVPEMSTFGEYPSIGNPAFRIGAKSVLGRASGVLLLSDVPANLNFWGSTLLVGALLAAIPVVANGEASKPGAGQASIAVSLPGSQVLEGLTLYWQSVFLDAGGTFGWSNSDGIATTFSR